MSTDLPLAVLPAPIAAAVDGRGHQLADDRPGTRWTCVRCGDCVITVTDGAVVYGPATRRDCPGRTSEGDYFAAWVRRQAPDLATVLEGRSTEELAAELDEIADAEPSSSESDFWHGLRIRNELDEREGRYIP